MAEFTVDRDHPFWKKVAICDPDECWLWLLSLKSSGYGQAFWEGRNRIAHQVAYEVANDMKFARGRIFDKNTECVCHSCDNKICCNPNHLWLGTQKDNIKDRDQKGRRTRKAGDDHWSRINPDKVASGDRHGSHTKPERVARGERQGGAKLSENDVRNIRARRANGEMCRFIADDYGVHRAHITSICKRVTWKHVI